MGRTPCLHSDVRGPCFLSDRNRGPRASQERTPRIESAPGDTIIDSNHAPCLEPRTTGVSAVGERDPEIALLYRQHAEELVRYGTRLSGSPDTASDAVQEAFVRLLGTSPKPDNPRAWLYKVLTNVIRDGIRRDVRRRQLLPHLSPVTSTGADSLRGMEAAEVAARVRRALATLRPKERVAVLMREEGFGHREIAEAIGTTTGTIGTLLARTFAKLAKSLPIEES